MKVLYFKYNEYHYCDNADESMLQSEKCILHSSVEGNELFFNKGLYNGRVDVCCRGGNWDNGIYVLSIDKVAISSGFVQRYGGDWEFTFGTVDVLISYLNLIEKYGPDYVLREYEVRTKDEYKRIAEMAKCLEPQLSVLKSLIGTQELNKLASLVGELISKHSLLTEQLRKIDEAKSLKG